jgi:hypothetical protein
MDKRDYVNQSGLSRQAIFNAVDASLARLDTPYIDLLQIHRADVKKYDRGGDDEGSSRPRGMWQSPLHWCELDVGVAVRTLQPSCGESAYSLLLLRVSFSSYISLEWLDTVHLNAERVFAHIS